MNRLFLGIGAQKAGTSWLYRCLEQHPDIRLPPVKELHFFDERARAGDAVLPPRFLTRRLPIELREFGAHILRHRDLMAIPWGVRYFFPHRDIDWYRARLAHPSAAVVGDMTPAYSTLDDAAVATIARELPGVRAILLLRNPIERAYSHALMDLTRSPTGAAALIEEADFIAHFGSRASRQRTAYTAVIDRWQRQLGSSRLFVGFFDEIAEQPDRLLAHIAQFLDLPAVDWGALPMLTRRVNAGTHRGVPAALLAPLEKMYRFEIESLAACYGGYPARWLAGLKSPAEGCRPAK